MLSKNQNETVESILETTSLDLSIVPEEDDIFRIKYTEDSYQGIKNNPVMELRKTVSSDDFATVDDVSRLQKRKTADGGIIFEFTVQIEK